jgi:sialidase-1
VPCDHIVFQDYSRQDPYHAHIIYSDDHGATWQIGGSADEGTNESTVLETADGWLYLNCRNKVPLAEGGNQRAIAWSSDSGNSFSPIVHDAALLEPICQASVCRLTLAPAFDRNRALFANPNSRTRDHLTVRLSYDECRTWPIQRLLHAGPAAYSDLCVTEDLSICCLYERGDAGPYERITLARFNLAWLTRGTDRLDADGQAA